MRKRKKLKWPTNLTLITSRQGVSTITRRIRGLTIEIGGETTALTTALGQVNKTTRDLKSELRDVERLLKLDPGNTELISQKQRVLAESVENTSKKLEQLKEAERQAQEQFARGELAEEQYRAIQREVIATERELRSLNEELARANWQGVTDKLDRFGKKATEIGKEMTKKVTAPIVGAGVAATKMASDFTDSMAKVSTLADTTQTSMEDLKKGIMDISNATGIAATDIASSVYDALSAGVETADVLDYVNANVLLTKAGFTDMGTAIDATSTILNAYGDTAFDVAKIGDILVKTQDEGKISVDELGKNLGRVIPTASALGVNLDQLGAAYAILTAKGQNASIATTNLNSMLGELGKSGSMADKALREMTGQSFRELVAEGKTVGDVLGMLDHYAQQTGVSLSDMFGSTTAGSAALTLLGNGVDEFNSKANIMNNSTGTMQQNFEKLRTPSEEMAIAINKIKNVMIELGAIILPVLSVFAEKIGAVADKIQGWDDRTKQIVVVIAGLVAAIGPVLIIIGQMSLGVSALIKLFAPLTAGIGGVSGAIGLLGKALTFLTGPIGIIIVSVTALIAIFVKLWKSNEDFRNKIIEIWNGILSFFKGIPVAMQTIGTNIIQGLINGMTGMVNKVVNLVSNIANAITGAFKRLLGIRSPSAVFEEYGKYIDEGLAKGIKDNKGTVTDQVQALADGIKQTMERNRDMLNRVGEVLIDSLRKRYEEMERDQVNALDREVENARKASDEKIAIYDREYAEKLKVIDEEAYRQIKALEDEIRSIDDLTDKEEKAIRDREHNERVSELEKQLMAAETAEERLRIQKDLDNTLANYERTLLLEKRRDQKDALREEIQAIRDAANDKKEELKEELEAKKQAEKDLLDVTIKSLESEKEAVIEHYKDLTSKEALEAEARKLIVEKNNDEIITLLKTYNPKWQDAGQSFADSLIDGLNSEKQPMEQAITDLFDFQDTIDERVQALEVLEEKLESLRSGSESSAGGGGGGLIGDTVGLLDELNFSLDEAIPKVDDLGDSVSNTVNTSISEFLRLEEEAKAALYHLAWSGQEVTEEMKENIVSNANQMADEVIAKLEKQKEDGLEHLKEMLDKSTEISEEEKEEAIRIATEKYDAEIEKAEEGKAKIEEILQDALENNTKITDEERKEIEKILNDLKNNSISLMTESQEEQEKILEDLKENATKYTAGMLANVVKNSKDQKEQTIEQAKKEYEERLKFAETLKKDGTQESIELANKVIEEAERQKDETIRQAEEMHQRVVDEVKKQGDDVVRQIDLDNGKIKSAWDNLRDWFTNNPIIRWIRTKEDSPSNYGGGASNLARNIGRNAQGTNYWRGGLTWVGELGPELVELPRGSKVFSNEQSMDMMGRKVEHSGTIRVEGVSNNNDFRAVVDIVMDELRREVRT